MIRFLDSLPASCLIAFAIDKKNDKNKLQEEKWAEMLNIKFVDSFFSPLQPPNSKIPPPPSYKWS
jgi:hypothetical protein